MSKKPFIIAYIIFLLLSFFYACKVLNLNKTTVSLFKKDDSKAEKVTRIPLQLDVTVNGVTTSYTKRLYSPYTVLDFLGDIRNDKKDFSFEKTYYRHGIEIDKVNNITAPTGYSWKVFLNDIEILPTELDSKMVSKNDTYSLKLVKN